MCVLDLGLTLVEIWLNLSSVINRNQLEIDWKGRVKTACLTLSEFMRLNKSKFNLLIHKSHGFQLASTKVQHGSSRRGYRTFGH